MERERPDRKLLKNAGGTPALHRGFAITSHISLLWKKVCGMFGYAVFQGGKTYAAYFN